jgi:hypothetical protein
VVSRCRDGQMPGSGETRPNPVIWAMPTHPDHTSAPAGTARTSSGQDRTALAWGRSATEDRSPTGETGRSAAGPRRTGPCLAGTRQGSVMTAVMPVTARPR